MGEDKPATRPGEQPGGGRDADYLRPPGVSGSFAPRADEPDYRPPPPTVSPQERAEYSRPAGSSVLFAPTTPGASAEGFDAPLGSRIWPTLHKAQSPWWKPDAARDPWRDPASPFWLGRPAIFTSDGLQQLSPDVDTEHTDEEGPEPEPAKTKEPRGAGRGRFGLSALLLTLITALLAGVVGGGAGWWLAERSNRVLTSGGVTLGTAGSPANRPPGSVADIAKRVSPAVVSIDVNETGATETGSGFVIDRSGYILTNNHVASVAAASGTIRVTYSDRASEPAKIVDRDP